MTGPSSSMEFWVGTYAEGGGRGLYPLTLTGAGLAVGPPEQAIANASYAVWSPATRTAYFVDEQAGRISAWTRVGPGWEARGRVESGGEKPCYLSLSPDNRLLGVANYGDGTVSLIELQPEIGQILGLAASVSQAGEGPDRERQDGPHAHCAVFDEAGESLFCVDLGLDRVFRYPIENGRFGQCDLAYRAPPGSGPRHLQFHSDGRHALLLTELSAELLLLERTADGFRFVDRIAAAPEAAEGNLGGHLGLGADGTVLVTNRGHDSVAAFAIADGRLARRGWAGTGGASPRHFHPTGEGLLIAHEEGGLVTLATIPGGPLRSLPIPGAAFVLAIPE